MSLTRRSWLRACALGALGALAWRRPVWAAAGAQPGDYFLLVHAAGGWDVTLWSDPRNERRGLVEPATTATLDTAGLRHWKAVAGGGFEILAPGLGPAIGNLYDLRDRMTIVNGISINTVSHDDGTIYAATGRHRAGGTVPESSIDVLLASELGAAQLIPDVSLKFPSYFVGDHLDRRAVPMRATSVEGVTRAFARSAHYLAPSDRAAISDVLAAEATDLGASSADPDTYAQLAGQHRALPQLTTEELTRAFEPKTLGAAYPALASPLGIRAAFAVEALRRDLVRCVAFGFPGLDTHNANYRQHGATLQTIFDILAATVAALDRTPHPNLSGAKLSEHTHILVISEFCRTPQINLLGGRDHYPNNSALILSPRFRGGRTFGATDPDQLLPVAVPGFVGGPRAITAPDVLATFLGAFGIDPRTHMRDGEVVRDLLA